MPLRSWAISDVGRVRDHNEDGWLIDDALSLFAVADGMGGHAAGEVASATALETVREQLAENEGLLDGYQQRPTPEARQALLSEIEGAVHAAAKTIFETAERNPRRRGMGTTLSMLVVVGGTGFMAHVGDSRVYLLRSGRLHQLSEDHSFLWEQIKRGALTPEQASRSRYKNVITRAVGITESVQVDTLVLDVLPGDRFMLCSDGLHGYLRSDEELASILEDGGESAVEQLVRLANERGGKDNITCLVLEVPGDAAHPSALEITGRLDTLQQIPLFRHLEYKELVKVLNATRVRDFDVGDVIIGERDSGDEFYVLVTGEVEVSKGGVPLTTLADRAHFGEMALVDRSPRSATVRATRPTRTLSLSRRAFFHLVKTEPVLASKLLWSFVQVLSHRLRAANDALSGPRADLLGFEGLEDPDPTKEIIPASLLVTEGGEE
jgi:serine/threonine protein phosphatase PrpC